MRQTGELVALDNGTVICRISTVDHSDFVTGAGEGIGGACFIDDGQPEPTPEPTAEPTS